MLVTKVTRCKRGVKYKHINMDAKPRTDAPHGMEPYDLGDSNDLGALSREQQTKLNSFKVFVAFHQ